MKIKKWKNLREYPVAHPKFFLHTPAKNNATELQIIDNGNSQKNKERGGKLSIKKLKKESKNCISMF